MNGFRLFMLGIMLGSIAAPTAAIAGGWKRQSAALCSGNLNNTAYADTTAKVVNWPTPEYCPYDDDSNMPRTGITTVNVHGKAANVTGISVSACVKVWNVSGGLGVGYFCGNAVANTATGVYTISPDLSVWQNPSMVNHFSYLKIDPTHINGGEVWGFYTAF